MCGLNSMALYHVMNRRVERMHTVQLLNLPALAYFLQNDG